MGKERIYVVVSTGDGASIERLTEGQLIERLNEGYYGSHKRVFSKDDLVHVSRMDLMAVQGIFIIAGDLIVPEAKKVVEEWKLP